MPDGMEVKAPVPGPFFLGLVMQNIVQDWHGGSDLKQRKRKEARVGHGPQEFIPLWSTFSG